MVISWCSKAASWGIIGIVMSSSVLLFGPPDAVAGPGGSVFESSNYSSNANSSGNVPSELIAKSRSSEWIFL